MGVVDERARICAAQAAGDPDGALAVVEVPATSANLGPGYDAFGVALDVPLIAVARPRGEARVTVAGAGADELPTGDDNLVWRAVQSWCAHVGTAVPDVSIHVDSAIPLERGMGSSSAAAVAGLLMGRALAGGRGSTADLLALATALEGHPDNAAAALVGGLVACTPGGGVTRVTPTPALRPVLCVPSVRQATSEARAALPAEVPLATAAAGAARATATFVGLAGLARLEATARVDELHEPARLALMPTSRRVVEALRAADVPSALSGAGPSVLAVVPAGDDTALDLVRRVVADAGADDPVELVPTRWHLAGATVRAAG